MRQESGTEAERLAYNTTGLPVLSTWEVTSGSGQGNKYTWGGSAWVQTHSGGAALVSDRSAAVHAGNYEGDKTIGTSSTREAIPAGAKSLWFRNNGATNFARFRFGDSTVTATTATGFRANADEIVQVPVPSDATHWAYIADTASVTASVVWGF